MSIVRLALVTSVAWRPVSLYTSHASMVPKRALPASAASRTTGTLSSNHLILGPEKYVASGSPVLGRNRSIPSSPASSLVRASVRVSCQTMALASGSPVSASHTIVVSRWLVMPTPSKSDAWMPASESAVVMTSSVFAQISFASCSTHPGCG